MRPVQLAQVTVTRQQPDITTALDRRHSGSNDGAVHQTRLAQQARRTLWDGIDAVVGEHIDGITPETARVQRSRHHGHRDRHGTHHAATVRLGKGIT